MKKRFIFIFIIGVTLTLGVSFRQKSSVFAGDTRVVTVHIDNETKTIATNAKNVGEVLQKLEANLTEHDKTEPELAKEIHGTEFSINVYRARPITVVDGANSYTVMTAERSSREIAQDAGFETKPEDNFRFKRSDDPFSGAPGTQMVIQRAKTLRFDLYGKTNSLSTNTVTVGDLLKERGVKLDPADELNVPLETRITEGMLVSITSVNRSVETVEEIAPFPEEQIKDAQQPLSYKKVQTPGVNGAKLVTYQLVSRNGGVAERLAVKEVVTKEPIKQVVVVGAKQAVNIPGNCGQWMSQAGITDSDAQWLIGKESGCNPGAVNRSSGACGIPQALPCSKLPCPLDASGAVCQLGWMENYVAKRYGSWAKARSFHASRGWY